MELFLGILIHQFLNLNIKLYYKMAFILKNININLDSFFTLLKVKS